jgi:DHA1 family tetracycline resistance protein-like MFS transporter
VNQPPEDPSPSQFVLPMPPVADAATPGPDLEQQPTGVRVRRAAVAFVFITVMIDMLSFGMIIPVLPHLIKSMAGGDLKLAAYWVGWFGTAFGIMQFVFSPVQGALSDRFGRRPVILLSNLGLGLDFLLMSLVNTLPLLFVGRIISGITAASVTTANAYIADVTPASKRAGAFGLMGAAFGIGFVAGPAIGSLLSVVNPRAPFAAAAILSLLNFCYGFFVLPESLPAEKRSAFDWAHASPIGPLLLLRRYPQVIGLATVVFLFSLAHFVYNTVFVLYVDSRYGWGQQYVGYILACVGVLSGFVQAWLASRLVHAFGERRTLLLGCVCGVIAFGIYGFASTGWVFLLGLPIGALWGLASPVTQAIMTRQVDPREQGRLQGSVSSLSSTAGIFGPTLFSTVFATFIGANAPIHLPGAPFLLSSALVLVALGIAWRFTSKLPAEH